jgi:hypothetical protein
MFMKLLFSVYGFSFRLPLFSRYENEEVYNCCYGAACYSGIGFRPLTAGPAQVCGIRPRQDNR